MRPTADRRLVACAGYAAQLAGSLVFVAAAGTSVPLLLLGIVAVRGRLRQRDLAAAADRADRVRRGGRPARGGADRRHCPRRLRVRARVLRPVAGIHHRSSGDRSGRRLAWSLQRPHLVQALAIGAFLAGRR